MKRKRSTLGGLLRLAAVALVATAVYQELKKPPGERQWHGRVANFVPYDFRPPSVERLRERFWNPQDPRIFTEHLFGVGWSLNLPSLLERLRGQRAQPPTAESEDTGETG